MQKLCKCGETMDMRLRTVVYSSKVEIDFVPVYSCESCQASELHQGIKSDLTGLIGELGIAPEKQQISFDEFNEFAYLMRLATDKDRMKAPLEAIVEERINQLLDVMLLAQSLGDEAWMEDIQKRLKQITSYSVTYDRF